MHSVVVERSEPRGWLKDVAAGLQRYFLGLLLSAYVLSCLVPAPGVWLRQTSLGTIPLFGMDISPVLPMLAVLLFNAGLGLRLSEIRSLTSSPAPLVAGLIASPVVPSVCVVVVALLAYLSSADYSGAVVGLAIVAAMPIANSSVAWAQNAGGRMSVSLGLLVASTVLSALGTPLVFAILRSVTGVAVIPENIGRFNVSAFVIVWVVLPTAAGVLLQQIVGHARVLAARPALKLCNVVVLLLLNYANASVSLPRVLQPSGGLVVLGTAGVAVVCCGVAFAVARFLGRRLLLQPDEASALVYGAGMKNTGVGLTLASEVLPATSLGPLTIVVYTLAQHLFAASSHPEATDEAGPGSES